MSGEEPTFPPSGMIPAPVDPSARAQNIIAVHRPAIRRDPCGRQALTCLTSRQQITSFDGSRGRRSAGCRRAARHDPDQTR